MDPVAAVTLDPPGLRSLAARSLGRLYDSFLWGPLSGVRLRDVELPPLPGPDWVRLDVSKAGICEDDVALLRRRVARRPPAGARKGPEAAEAAAVPGLPHVPGHEILGRVAETGRTVRGVEPGDRVVVVPHPDNGAHTHRDGRFGPLPGGWSEGVLVHGGRLLPVPDALDDRTAALLEPLSVALHAVLGARPLREGPVLVVGGGTLAHATAWALRAVGFEGEVVARTEHEHAARLIRRMGASEVTRPGDEAGRTPGFPLVFHCGTGPDALDGVLRDAAPRGRIVLVGCAGRLPSLDPTPLLSRELRISGSRGHGRDTFRGVSAHTFALTRDLLLAGGAPVHELVTHVFPLWEYRRALTTAADPGRTASVKVLLDPTA